MILIFDFEVFKHDWLVVFKPLGQDPISIVNDREMLIRFYEEHKKDIFAGYNVKHYDNYILKAILSDVDPYKVSSKIIDDKEPGWKIRGIKRYNFAYLDLFDDIVSHPSLKKIEGNLGMSIKESNVDFKIDRPLTKKEIEDVKQYCIYDTIAAERLLEARYEENVKPKIMMINHFGLNIDNSGKTFAQLSALVLGARKKKYYDERQYDLPKHIDIKNKKILDLYKGELDYKKRIKVMIGGIEHKLGYGGLHGALKKFHKRGKMINLDVRSYYPSMMIEYGYMSRGLSDPKKYQELYNERVKMKRNNDPMNEPYKIILNSTYGAMKNKYNNLYDPKQPNQITITGQLMLVELIEKLEPHCKLIQSNTDGILIDVESSNIDDIFDVVEEWEDKTRMVLEAEKVVEIHQKDVNNYILITEGGKIKLKGGYVGNYDGGNYEHNNMTIVDKAVVDYFIEGKSARDTINECDDMIKFQIVCDRGGKYEETRLINTETDKFTIEKKVNRIFPSKKKNNLKLYKMKKGRPNAFPNTPDHTIIYNGEMSSCPLSKKDIDLEWYVEMAEKRINDFY